MRARPTWLVIGAALLLSGCGQLDVRMPGTVRSRVVETVTSSEGEPLVLTFDRLGHLTLNGRALDLPQARERIHFGLGVVDAGAIPAPWRPTHATEGGLLVSSLQKASPLAIAGLRPFDRIDALDGEPLLGPADLVHRLSVVEPEQRVALDVVKPNGDAVRLEALAAERVGDDQRIWIPLLFELRSGTTGGAIGTGPLDLLFSVRTRQEHRYVLDAEQGHSVFEERFGWDFLGGLLGWESLSDPATGESKSLFRLFWIPIGDDL